jgi:hypothetical protein
MPWQNIRSVTRQQRSKCPDRTSLPDAALACTPQKALATDLPQATAAGLKPEEEQVGVSGLMDLCTVHDPTSAFHLVADLGDAKHGCLFTTKEHP